MEGGDSLRVPGSGRRSTGMRMLGELMQTRIDEDPEGAPLPAHRPHHVNRKPSKLEVSHSSFEFVDELHQEEGLQHDVLSIGAVSTMESQPGLEGRTLPPIRVASPAAVSSIASDSEEPIEQPGPCGDETQQDETRSPGSRFGTFLEYVLRLRHKLKSKCTPSCFKPGNVYNTEDWAEHSLPRREQDKLDTVNEGRNSNEDCAVASVQPAHGSTRSKKHHRATSMRTRCSMIEEHFSQIHQHAGIQRSHRRCVSLDDAVVFVVVSPHSGAKSLNKKFMDSLVLRDVSHNSNLVARPHPHQHQHPPVRNFQIETA